MKEFYWRCKSLAARDSPLALDAARSLRGARRLFAFMIHATLFLAVVEISPWLVLPFALLLLLIAAMPLSPERVKTWWVHNYGRVALARAAGVGAIYLLGIPERTALARHSKRDTG